MDLSDKIRIHLNNKCTDIPNIEFIEILSDIFVDAAYNMGVSMPDNML